MKSSVHTLAAFASLALLCAAIPAIAGETITYSYDELGRLTKVARTGTVNSGATECYTYDPASNRSNVAVATSSDCSIGAGVSFSINDVAVAEGGSLSFTVTKTGSASGTITLDYATANGTATAGSDYTAISGTLSFLSTDTSKTVAVVTTNDTASESNETVLLNLSNASAGATISDSQGVGTINDNDQCAGVGFTITSNGAVTEGASSVFTISKSGTASSSCSVNYATASGTAAAGSDYTTTSGTLTFTSAQTSHTISVPTSDDTAVESAETFTMSLSSPTAGATVGTPGSATATINDNDTAANQPPVANFDNGGSMTCGDVITINVVANDTDPDGNYPLSLVSATGASVVSSTDVQVTGTRSGTKSFTYVVKDSLGAQATGSGSVNVLAPCQ